METKNKEVRCNSFNKFKFVQAFKPTPEYLNLVFNMKSEFKKAFGYEDDVFRVLKEAIKNINIICCFFNFQHDIRKETKYKNLNMYFGVWIKSNGGTDKDSFNFYKDHIDSGNYLWPSSDLV